MEYLSNIDKHKTELKNLSKLNTLFLEWRNLIQSKDNNDIIVINYNILYKILFNKNIKMVDNLQRLITNNVGIATENDSDYDNSDDSDNDEIEIDLDETFITMLENDSTKNIYYYKLNDNDKLKEKLKKHYNKIKSTIIPKLEEMLMDCDTNKALENICSNATFTVICACYVYLTELSKWYKNKESILKGTKRINVNIFMNDFNNFNLQNILSYITFIYLMPFTYYDMDNNIDKKWVDKIGELLQINSIVFDSIRAVYLYIIIKKRINLLEPIADSFNSIGIKNNNIDDIYDNITALNPSIMQNILTIDCAYSFLSFLYVNITNPFKILYCVHLDRFTEEIHFTNYIIEFVKHPSTWNIQEQHKQYIPQYKTILLWMFVFFCIKDIPIRQYINFVTNEKDINNVILNYEQNKTNKIKDYDYYSNSKIYVLFMKETYVLVFKDNLVIHNDPVVFLFILLNALELYFDKTAPNTKQTWTIKSLLVLIFAIKRPLNDCIKSNLVLGK